MTFQERLIGAARLEPAAYEDVEHDEEATGQAAAVVVLASLAGGIGRYGDLGFGGLVLGALLALFGWCAWAFATYVVGTRLLPTDRTEADVGQMLRTLGFASAPGLVNALGIVPGLGWIAALVASVWMYATMVVAVRQALDYESTGRAVAVCAIGFVLYLVVVFLALVAVGVLLGLFGGGAAGGA